uniref:MULE transposase domain-containing protein n=1 Tax=Daphnia galeata TaxID=27404 RepID=A0A8J2RDS2_9CRUS|nr:unnamed protein product [Daphnia galeata]
MSGKRKKDYVAVFSSILQLLNPTDGYPKVQEFLMDFEAAMWQTCKAVLPTVKPVGCSFHLTQSFYHNIKTIGLSIEYRTDSKTRRTCRELMSLYLLPADKIRRRFYSIASKSTIWTPENWSMFMQHVRTNNNVEGTHNNLKAVAGHASINLANFLCKMREEADKIGMTAKLLFQKQALKKLNKNAESKQRQVTLQWEAYNRADNPLSSRKLLVDLGKVTSKHSKSELREMVTLSSYLLKKL